MSGRSTSTTALTVAGVTLATGVLAYAVYFDYKRRTDTEFRRQLRKEKKKAEKTKAAAASAESLASSASANVSPEELRAALATLRKEALPATPEEKEMYFMTSVGEGEQLATQGPTYRVQAATAFYRALRVYPSPVELIQIYEKTIPPPVFQLVVQLANMDTIERVQGYYDLFPGKAMNVAIKTIDVPESGESGPKKRKVLVVTKDFAAGEVIYKEYPVVAVLDPDLEGAGSHCSHCLRVIDSDTAIPAEDHPLSSVYCSVECQKKATAQYHTLLFSSGSPLPTELAALDTPPEIQAGMAAARAEAQAAFVEFLRGEAKERNVPHLLARFIARQVGMETAKMLPGGLSRYMEYGADLPPVDDEVGQEYSLWDHVERLRFLDVKVPDDEQNIMQKLLRTALPGLEGFLNDERHQVLKGKIMYNSMGITLPPRGSSTDDLSVSGLAGRDDKPVSSERPEDQEKSRTPFGTSRQIGSGFFLVSAYLNHSCAPSAIPSFRDGTAQVSLVANKDLKAGDELTIAFVDVTQHLEETAGEARRRRRWELARGWRFACTCDKCMSENIPAAAEGETEEAPVEEADQAEPELKDESKVEEIALKYDA